MNTKKKRLYTRKKRVLRRIGWALLALLLVNTVCHTYYLLPVQRLWTVEEQWGCGRTKVVERMWQDGRLWYFTENENAVLLMAQKPTLTGWQAETVKVLDCSKDAPIHGDVLRARGYYAFGRVDDSEVEAVRLSLEGGSEKVDRLTTDSDWIKRNGCRYFLFCGDTEELVWSGDSRLRIRLTALDSSGREVACLDM